MFGLSKFFGRSLTLGVAASLSSATLAFAGATITGTVTYDGKVPNLKPIAMDADPTCAAKHPTPAANEMLVLGSGNTMGNILVSVKSGLPAGKTYPAPKDPVVMDQNGCQYKPHVFVLQTGQELKVLNSDGVLHNVHAMPKVNPQFNMAIQYNPRSIRAVLVRLNDLMHLSLNLAELDEQTKELEGKLDFLRQQKPEFSAYIQELDKDYRETPYQGGLDISGNEAVRLAEEFLKKNKDRPHEA